MTRSSPSALTIVPSHSAINLCAIYTRKSSTEGLANDFNSLDAQREACRAYISSQGGEGWREVDTTYEDGGISGGSLNRPEIQRLLEDIASGKVQTVVVYKIDRLTRSLADFAKLVELFDRVGARFVSVTQAFNTTTSMGRLTLNTLLSFAQFEREISGERIRDKKEAASRKGMFVGGCAMLGYDLRDRKLVINDAEAAAVRYMFDRYLALKSTSKLLADLNASEYRPKNYATRPTDKPSAGTWYFSNLVQMLRNRRYVGEVKWRNEHFPGVHEAIISLKTFDAVQRLLDATSIPKRSPYSAKLTRLLSGILFDDQGVRMISRRTGPQNNKHWGNYVSYSRLHKHATQATLTTVRVSRLEPLVLGVVKTIASRIGYNLPAAGSQLPTVSLAIKSHAVLFDQSADRRLVTSLVERVTLGANAVVIDFKPPIGCPAPSGKPHDEFLIEGSPNLWRVTVDASLATGSAFRTIEFPDQSGWKAAKPRFNKPLLRALHNAHIGKAALESGKRVRLSELAKAAGTHLQNYYRLMQVAYLAPDIQALILEGRQPRHLCIDMLLNNRLPILWTEQRRVLGIDYEYPNHDAPLRLRRSPGPRVRRRFKAIVGPTVTPPSPFMRS